MTVNARSKSSRGSQAIAEVLILATMSAGKSTLLNALLGQELLPVANQATTARIFCIEDHDGLDSFEIQLESTEDQVRWIKATPEDLKKLNDTPESGLIKLRGDIPGIRNKEGVRLVIYDTPGPNNSMDEEHTNTTLNIMKDGQHGVVIYLMNATQLCVNDDSVLLRELRDVHNHPEHSHKKVLFLLNKADQLDEERGEHLDDIVKNTVSYLENHGFHHPMVLPISAQAALLARKSLAGDEFTRREKNDVQALAEYLGKSPERLLNASTLAPEQQQAIKQLWQMRDIPSSWIEKITTTFFKTLVSKSATQKSLEDAHMETLIHASGVYALESLIQEEILRLIPVDVYMDYTSINKRLRVGNKLLSNQHELVVALNNEEADSAIEKIINAFSQGKRPINLQVFTADTRIFNEARKSASKTAHAVRIKVTTSRIEPSASSFMKDVSILSRTFPIK